MASNNRATLINRVVKVAKKHFKPVAPPPGRTVFEHLVFATLVQNSPHEAAEQIFERLKADYFDWNEVRVSSIRELTEVLKPLNDPQEAATRLRRVLQSVFESQYSFDLEATKKQNIGQAVKDFEKLHGTDAFTVAYVVQNGLSGHSIPVNDGLLESLRIVEVVSDAEAAKRTVPGLERTIAKTKGVEVGSMLHQIGVEMHRAAYGPTIRKLLLEIAPGCKDRLPKRAPKKPPAPPEPPKAKGKAKKAEAKKPAEKKSAKAAAPKKTVKTKAAKAAAPKKTVKKKVKKKVAKKAAKKAPAKKSTGKKTKKAAGKKLSKRKPR